MLSFNEQDNPDNICTLAQFGRQSCNAHVFGQKCSSRLWGGTTV